MGDGQRTSFDEGGLNSFFAALGWNFSIWQQAKKSLEMHLASEFSVLALTRPNEPTLSAIIAELLNPNGKHGQGELFLNEFLNLIDRKQLQGSSRVNVTCEDRLGTLSGTRRPIDITLDFEGTYCIGIENKPWAREQPNQVRDYSSQLANRYPDKKWLLVYISAIGAEPDSIEKEDKERLLRSGNLLVLSYAIDFRRWLETCHLRCKAEKIRWFLMDFIEFVGREFPSGTEEEGGIMASRDFADVLASCVLTSQENFKLAGLVHAHFDEVRRRVIVPFTEALTHELYQRLDPQQWSIENPFSQPWPPRGYNDFVLTRKAWEGRFDVYIQTNKLREACVGLKKREEIPWPTDALTLRRRIDEKLLPDLEPSAGPTSQYVWSHLKPPYWDWEGVECLTNMYWKKDETVGMFASVLLRVIDVASSLIDGKPAGSIPNP